MKAGTNVHRQQEKTVKKTRDTKKDARGKYVRKDIKGKERNTYKVLTLMNVY